MKEIKNTSTNGRWGVTVVCEKNVDFPAKGASVLEDWGYIAEHEGRSGFAARNIYRIRKKNPKIKEFTAPLLVVRELTRDQKEACGYGS